MYKVCVPKMVADAIKTVRLVGLDPMNIQSVTNDLVTRGLGQASDWILANWLLYIDAITNGFDIQVQITVTDLSYPLDVPQASLLADEPFAMPQGLINSDWPNGPHDVATPDSGPEFIQPIYPPEEVIEIKQSLSPEESAWLAGTTAELMPPIDVPATGMGHAAEEPAVDPCHGEIDDNEVPGDKPKRTPKTKKPTR